jgi:Holliday junction resolvase
MQRSKGQRGERELFALLSDRLGVVVRRNVDQARAGGAADGLDVPGWAVEVKRQQTARVTQWWKQAVEQANMLERRPVLFYRANYKPWRATMLLCDVAPENFYGEAAQSEPVELSLEAACLVIRESLPGSDQGRA